MAISSATVFLFIFILSISSLRFVFSSSIPASSCLKPSNLFLYPLRSQCPSSIPPTPPIRVDGDLLDQIIFNKRIAYTSVLFYASWCQFSKNLLHTFETLGSAFPQIEHVMIEQSSAMPSVLSRYGIHSFPAILIVNQTSTLRYRGPKSFPLLVQFYERTAGLQQVEYYNEGELVGSHNEKSIINERLNIILSARMLFEREPYLAFSIIFLSMKMAVCILPRALSQLKAFWISYVPRLNLEIFGETSHIGRRIVDTVDVRRVWAKLRLSKTRNFQEGARNARFWASLALGESS